MAIDPALQALIDADPSYAKYVTDAQAQDAADRAQRNASMQRAMEDYGLMPDLSGSASQLGLTNTDLSQIQTPEAQTLANANTTSGMSTTAQLNLARSNALKNIVNALAGRGMMRSGDTGYNTGQEEQAATLAQYNAQKTLLDYLAGIQSGYAAAVKQRQSDQYGQFSDAYGRVLSAYQNGLATTTSSTGSTPATTGSTTPVSTLQPVNPSSVVVPNAYTGATPNYGPAGSGFSGGYTSPASVSQAVLSAPVVTNTYNPYKVKAGANIQR
jgi:hypothetical protein